MFLNTGQQLNYFDSLIVQYRTSITSFSSNLLSSIPLNPTVTSSKISGTLSTGEMVIIHGKCGRTGLIMSSITNSNTYTKLTII